MSDIDWSKAPEGATHYLPVVDDYGYDACWYKQDADGQWRGCNVREYARSGSEPWSLDCDDVEIFTRYLIHKPGTEWNGTGLPPVGTVCDLFFKGCGQGRVKVLYMGSQFALCWNLDEEHEQCGDIRTEYEFCPIRTPEQIAAEEREAAIMQMIRDAGREPVERTKKQAARLYDAGYRKQEQTK